MAEPLNATFFALQKRDKAVLLPATIVFLVLFAGVIAAFVALNWNTFAQIGEFFRTAAAQQEPSKMDETAAASFVFRMLGLIASAFLLMFPLYLIVAAYEAACLRWMIRGEAPGFFGITLDHDTWRVYGVYWCWFLVRMVISFALSIFMIPIMFMGLGEMMRSGSPPDPEVMLHWQLTVQLPLTLLSYVPLAFISVRFGPAAATSIARRRFSFFEAWTVTRDRFWALFGSYALIWIGFLLVYAIVVALAFGHALLLLWPAFTAHGAKPDSEAMRTFFEQMVSPQGLIGLGLIYGFALIAGMLCAILAYGVNARAARAALDEGKIEVAPAD